MARVQGRQNQTCQMSKRCNKKQQRKSCWIQQNHRGLMWESTYGGHLIQFPWSIRVTWSWFPRTILRQLLSISKDGNTAISAGNLCQCSSHCSINIRKTLVCHEVCRALFERGGRISSLEVFKSSHGTQQPALTGLAVNGELDQMTSRGLSQHIFL